MGERLVQTAPRVPTTGLWSEVRRPWVQVIVFSIVASLLTWGYGTISPTTGLDPSWQAGLAMAQQRHLSWGPDINFTYGPLGFLIVQSLFFRATSISAFLYTLLLHFTLFALLFLWCRKKMSLVAAIFVSYLIGGTAVALVDPGDLLMVPVLLGAMLVLDSKSQTGRLWMIGLLGIAAGTGLLVKLSMGVVAIAVIAVLVATAVPRRMLAEALVGGSAILLSSLLAWVATANDPGNLGDFTRNAMAIAGGYSSAMQIQSGRDAESLYAILVIMVLAAVAVPALRTGPRREVIGVALIGILATWWALKEGFVRHDRHDLTFFGVMAALLPTLLWVRSRPRSAIVAAASLTFTIGITWVASGSVPSVLYTVRANTAQFFDLASTLAKQQRFDKDAAQARSAMQAAYGLSPSQKDAVRGRSVAIEPWESAMAWAFPNFHWDPEPVFQAYTAYTPGLDRLNAKFLASKRAPERIIEQDPNAGYHQPPLAPHQGPKSDDGRNPYFDPPRTWVTMLCRYVQLNSSQSWQILERVANRCGRPRAIERLHPRFGQLVSVPQAGGSEMVVARFDPVPLSLTYQLASVVLKPAETHLVTPAGDFRFVVGTAGELHVMRPSPGLGYSPEYTPTTIDAFRLNSSGLGALTGHYTVTFYAISMSGLSPTPGGG